MPYRPRLNSAKAHGYRLIGEFYDAAVSGADPVAERPGFKAMLDRIAGNGVRVILVESPDRFARDLSVQLTGHDYLRSFGVELVPTSAPDFFTTDTPTAVLVRQVLGAISQFEKASLVAKLRAARERKIAAGGRGSGRFAYAQKVPEVVTLVRELHGQRQSLRQISKTLAAQGHLTVNGPPGVFALDAQAIFFRRCHQPRRPPLAKIRPGSPAPTTGPGTAVIVAENVE